METVTITPRDLAARRRYGGPVELIDVRTPVEFRELHAEAARNVPLSGLDPAALMAARGDGRPLYVICRTGGRGRQASELFRAAGFPGVVNVEGGTQAWAECGLPVVRGPKAVSLERQVRIAAGLLVMTGTALGAFAHPAFLGVAAFVGAGLTFSGLTDTCGMGLVLARMPWNTGAAACTTPPLPTPSQPGPDGP